MPIYKYDCPDCGRLFEKRVSMTQADEACCPHCGNTHPKRRLSRITIKGQTQTSGSSGTNIVSSSGFG